MAIAYTNKSKFSKLINQNNWPKILGLDGVKIAHSNPNLDPCGYRSILSLKLAEKYYKIQGLFNNLLGYKEFYKLGMENKKKVIVRPKETDLLALLEVGYIDYLFIYRSVAIQHKLNFITLPPEISMKNTIHSKFYKTAKFKIQGKRPDTWIKIQGAPMVYGITIPENQNSPQNKNGAKEFLKFLFSKRGQKIMTQNGQGFFKNPKIEGKLPKYLNFLTPKK